MSEIQERILRAREVRERLGGMSSTGFWRFRKKSDFPKAMKIQGTSIKGWHESAVNQWIIDNSKGVE